MDQSIEEKEKNPPQDYNQDDIITLIMQRNNKILGYGEIQHLFESIKREKPHFTVTQYITAEFKPQRVPSYISQKSALINKTVSGAILYLRVFDQEQKINKCLKIYLLDHFLDGLFVSSINQLYESMKTLIRTDLILQVYGTYVLNGNDDCKTYFVIEYENYENSLSKLYNHNRPNMLPENLKQIMENTLNYCSDRSSIKEKTRMKTMNFPQDYLKYFFMVKADEEQCKIKLNILSPEIFQSNINTGESLIMKNIKSQTSSKKKREKGERNKQVNELNSKLGRLLLDVQVLNQIRKEDLVDTLRKNFNQIIECHGVSLFEIIAQHPKYRSFELEEYSHDFFILGTQINNNYYNLKCEKFQTLKELEDTIKLYEQFYQNNNHMLIPVNSYEPLLVDEGYYLLIEEQVMPNSNKFKKNKQLQQNLNSTFITISQICDKKNPSKQEKLRILQIVVQLLRFTQHLYSNNFYHGDIDFQNTLVSYSNTYSAEPPTLYFSNPLFLRNKENKINKRKNANDFESLDDIIFLLLVDQKLDSIIDQSAIKQLSRAQENYFQDIINHRHEANQSNKSMMQYEENGISFYVNRLTDLFKLFEEIYQKQMSDKYIRINKKWLITLNKYQVIQGCQNFLAHNHNHLFHNHQGQQDDYEYDENEIFDDQEGEFGEDDYYDDDDEDDDDDGYGFWQFMDEDEIDSDMDEVNHGIYQLDQCITPEMFQLKVDKIVYNFKWRKDFTIVQILKSIASNNNLISINFKSFSSCSIRNNKNVKEHTNDYLNNILKNCTNLQTVKLDIQQEDIQVFDVKLLQNLHDLQKIKIKVFLQLNPNIFKNENQFMENINFYKNFLELFKINKQFKSINIYPFTFFICSLPYNNINWYFQSIGKLLNSIYQNINNQEYNNTNPNKRKRAIKQLYSFSQLTQINSQELLQRVQSKSNDDVESAIDAFFRSNNIRHSQIRKIARQNVLQQAIGILNKYHFLTLKTMIDEEKKDQLILKFSHLLDQQIGSLVIKLTYDEQFGFMVVSEECNDQDRYKCYQFRFLVPEFSIRMIERWILCDYDKKIKQYMFGENYFSLCRHCDTFQFQKLAYLGQKDLKKLTLHIEFCENYNKMLTQNKDFFGLSQIPSKQLTEIKLSPRIFDYRNVLQCYKNIKYQLQNARYLCKVQIVISENFIDINIRKQLMKIKRLVSIQFVAFD
ncbi:hypothetical protein TTHERM_01126430 (macronuclear) [Tetrahymena thermophila SB210]|uniref:Uncharacterized protein n=1 Tax=Tetrahymena thermophila (strain SB210) TaxID=312017 RepID=Q24DC6_TETTS|nr:hypothetical protein TTHERM_01126430 [Tetrahymena thermophila SB210]EAS05779.3 hypothetical protein TTHERM_01126430 [Tetrahymena thermophila SB210]|eukprot:XP_001026024.3 hypothetical protein TTHERM_01126430 [Tetrahymena thermophila SB210]